MSLNPQHRLPLLELRHTQASVAMARYILHFLVWCPVTFLHKP